MSQVAYDYRLNPPEPTADDLAYERECERLHEETMNDILAGKNDEFWADSAENIIAAVRQAMKGVMGHNRPEWIAKTITDAVQRDAEKYAEWFVENNVKRT